MAQLSNLDMSDATELGEGFRIVPPGEYLLHIESSEIKDTKKKDGQYLELVNVVGDGEYEGAKIFTRLNLWNNSQQAVDIAKSQLRALCEAIVGQPFVNDSSLLHSRPFIALVDNEAMNKDDPNSKRSNSLVFRKGSIRSINSGAVPGISAGPVVQAAPAQTAPVKAGVGKPPWKK